MLGNAEINMLSEVR